MKAVLTAIFGKFTALTSLYIRIGGRMYLDELPKEIPPQFPYIILTVVSFTRSPDESFGKKMWDIVLQFSIFSSSGSVQEIADIEDDLRTLYEDCSLTITGKNLLWSVFDSLTEMTEEIGTTEEGISSAKFWAAQYSMKIEES